MKVTFGNRLSDKLQKKENTADVHVHVDIDEDQVWLYDILEIF